MAPDFHRLRIRGKRLRYSLEFTAALYGGRSERFVRSLARLQDGLGLMQDAEVATDRLRSLATAPGSTLPPATVFAMGEVAERYRFEAEALLAGMPKRLKVLEAGEWQELSALMARRREDTLIVAPPRAVRRPAAASTTAPGLPDPDPIEATAGPVPPVSGPVSDPSVAGPPSSVTEAPGDPAPPGPPSTDTDPIDETGDEPADPPTPEAGGDDAPGGPPPPWSGPPAPAPPGRGAVVVPITGHDERGPTGPGTATGSGRAAP